MEGALYTHTESELKLAALVEKKLKEKFPRLQIRAEADFRNVVTLSGECESWDELIAVGHSGAKIRGVKNIVSDMTVKGLEIPRKDYSEIVRRGREKGVVDTADVVIVGAGVTGCAAARELSRYKIKTIVIDKADDVCTGASKANNGDIHAGHAVTPGTLKARLNIEGNRMYTQWSQELGFELQRCGALGVIESWKHLPFSMAVLKIAKMNGVDGACLVDTKTAYEIEPKLKNNGHECKCALYLPSFGLVEPYQVVVAMAENAAENGVKFMFDCALGAIDTEKGGISAVVTEKGIIKTGCVINCAGIYADEVSAMAGDRCCTLHNRKGTIAILDKNCPPEYDCLCDIFDPEALKKKNKESKGGGMCRTPEFNILLGPSATEVPDKEDTSTTAEDLDYAMGRNQYEKVNRKNIIRIFAGARPADFSEDFVIERSEICSGLINCAGIQSPGLSAAPAIGVMLSELYADECREKGIELKKNESFNPIRKEKPQFRRLSREEQSKLIEKNPAYGRIICRCETITEGEILDAIHSPIVPHSVDAVKRRTRAGMGRCQGGFCQSRVLEILARELGEDWLKINLKGRGSEILLESNRQEAEEVASK